MGLFRWLFGGEPERVVESDRIWESTKWRWRGIVGELAAQLDADSSVLLVAHFPDTLTALTEALRVARLPYEPLPGGCTPLAAVRLAFSSAPRVLLGLVCDLVPSKSRASDEALDSPLPVVLAERHFLRRYDDRVARFAAGLGSNAAITAHLSFDDHLMKTVIGESVRNILKKLGMQSNESISSRGVSRRIRRLQNKFAEVIADNNVDAVSPEEWLRANHK